MHRLKIILAGQKSFGAAALEMLRKTPHEIAAVYAPEGDKLNRHSALCGLTVNPGGRLDSRTMPRADLLIAAHSHEYVSRPVRNRLALGAIGYHPSLLPLHRGRDAVEWAVRMGDPATGGTVFWLSDLATWEPSLTGAPRLHRPELPQIGSLPEGFTVRRE